MRRRTFDALMATGGLVLAIILLVAGGLLTWAHGFANDNVHNQLVAQKIAFPPVAGIKAQNDAEITKYVTPYAGQAVDNGQKAQVFADHYIKVHLAKVAGGKTYSEVSGAFLAMKPTDPNYATVAQQRHLEDGSDRGDRRDRVLHHCRCDVAAVGAGLLAPAPGVSRGGSAAEAGSSDAGPGRAVDISIGRRRPRTSGPGPSRGLSESPA